MNFAKSTFSYILLFLLIAQLFTTTATLAENTGEISGSVQQGYRVLTLPDREAVIDFTVFRGDYLKFAVDDHGKAPTLVIPSLNVTLQLAINLSNAPFVKMKQVGEYSYSAGRVRGVLKVIEFDKPQYRALTSEEASEFIAERSPLILDVRTLREYQGGHMENAVHIPIQELQTRYTELTPYLHQDILIYCATGNRSTVAAKILIDRGFTRISNLREGIHIWYGKGFPLVR